MTSGRKAETALSVFFSPQENVGVGKPFAKLSKRPAEWPADKAGQAHGAKAGRLPLQQQTVNAAQRPDEQQAGSSQPMGPPPPRAKAPVQEVSPGTVYWKERV